MKTASCLLCARKFSTEWKNRSGLVFQVEGEIVGICKICRENVLLGETARIKAETHKSKTLVTSFTSEYPAWWIELCKESGLNNLY